MGKIADDYLEEACWQACTSYFKTNHEEAGATHGYPVVCQDCWAEADTYQRAEWRRLGFRRAIFKAI